MRARTLLVVVVLVLAGCADDGGSAGADDRGPSATASTATADTAGTEPPGSATGSAVTISAREFAFDVPDTVPAGEVTFTLENEGAMSHHAQLFQIPSSSVEAYLDDDYGRVMAEATALGGPATVEPLATSAPVTTTLQPGTYAVYCWLITDGREHGARGMRATFTVEGDRPEPSEPEVAGTIGLDEYTFDVPATFDGKGAWQVENQGSDDHELVLLELEDGATVDDARDTLGGWRDQVPAPAALVFEGGVMSLRVRKSAVVELDLAPGTYALACFVPGPDNVRHYEQGMLDVVEIT